MSFGNHRLLNSLPTWRDRRGRKKSSTRLVLRVLIFTGALAALGLFAFQIHSSSSEGSSRLEPKQPKGVSSTVSSQWKAHEDRHGKLHDQGEPEAQPKTPPSKPVEAPDHLFEPSETHDVASVLPPIEPREGLPAHIPLQDSVTDQLNASGRPWYSRWKDKIGGFRHRASGAGLPTRSILSQPSYPQSLYPSLADAFVGERLPNEEIQHPVYTHGDRPYLGKVTVNVAKDDDTDNHYERGIRTHVTQNKFHNYAMHTLRYSLTTKPEQMWSKPSYLLSVMLRELAKPAEERLQWLFWVDADTVIANPRVPIETFLPPVEFNDIHLLLTNDFNGLNNGLFPIRVCLWSVDFLAAVMSFSHFNPTISLQYHEQSAMEHLLKHPKFGDHALWVPQRWFNAYPGEANETLQPYMIKRGDMLIHFAGFGNKKEMMSRWLQRVELHDPEWEIDLIHTAYPNEVRDYWMDVRRKGKDKKAEVDKIQDEARALIEDVKVYMKEFKEEVDYMRRNSIKQATRALRTVLDAEDKKDDKDLIISLENDVKESAEPLISRARKANRVLYEEAHGLLLRYEEEQSDTPYLPGAASESEDLQSQLSELRKLLVENKGSPRYLERAIGDANSARESLKQKMSSLKKHASKGNKKSGDSSSDDLDEIDKDVTEKEKGEGKIDQDEEKSDEDKQEEEDDEKDDEAKLPDEVREALDIA